MKANRIRWTSSSREGYSWVSCFGYYQDGRLALLIIDRVHANDYVMLRSHVAVMQQKITDTLTAFDQLDRIYAAHEDLPT